MSFQTLPTSGDQLAAERLPTREINSQSPSRYKFVDSKPLAEADFQRQLQSLENAFRQPSHGRPPPTPLESGFKPNPVAPPTGSPPATPAPSTPRPTSAPSAGGMRIPSGAVGAGALTGGLDFATRLASGQSVQHAAIGAAATTAGSVGGAVVGGAIGGPLGAAIGGWAGGAVAGAAYDFFTRPSSGEAQNPSAQPPVNQFWRAPSSATRGVTVTFYPSFREVGVPNRVNRSNVLSFYLEGPNRSTNDKVNIVFAELWSNQGTYYGGKNAVEPGSISIQAPASPEGQGDRSMPQPLPFLQPDPAVSPKNPSISDKPLSPASPSGSPHPDAVQARSPLPGVSAGATPVPVPLTNPATGQGATPAGSTLNPGQTLPSPVVGKAAAVTPAPAILLNESPFNLPQGNNGQPGVNPGVPATAQPGGSAAPSSAPSSPKVEPTTNKAPVSAPAAPTAPTTTKPEETELTKQLEEITKLVAPLAAMTALLQQLNDRTTNLENKMPTPQNLEDAAAAGTCRTTQPGGCSRKMNDETVGAASGAKDAAEGAKQSAEKANNKLDELLAAMQAAELAQLKSMDGKLNTINTKLGPQVDGGLSGKLGQVFNKVTDVFDLVRDKFAKIYNQFGLDRVVSLLTLIASLHNAMMLSRSVGEGLVEAANTVVQAMQAVIPGFLKNPDGTNFEVDLGKLFTEQIEDFLKNALGAENFYELKGAFIKANRILSTSANMLSSVRGMTNAMTDGLNVIGGWVAQGFNGLQREGIVSDRTWPWMDENPNFKFRTINRFTQGLENVEDATSSIQQLAQAPIEFVSEANELVESTTELKKALDEDTAKKVAEEDKKDEESQSPEISGSDLLRG